MVSSNENVLFDLIPISFFYKIPPTMLRRNHLLSFYVDF